MADAKTFVLHVDSKCFPSDYFLEGRSLSGQTVVRDLGVLLDSELSFVVHIDLLCSQLEQGHVCCFVSFGLGR